MQFKSFLAVSAASVPLAFGLAVPAFAQSTGSVDFDKEIIVTGTRTGVQEVGGISAPDTAKAKSVLTQENIGRQNPGQSILDTINQVPGVSFQNNDAYGSSGGTLNIRGFSSDRVSLTFDGVPLNDSGGYAIFSNQQVDPELIEQVNVNLGTTDVDSPTASAAGGTVNLRTKKPDHDFGVMLSGSAGDFEFMRIFAKVETGDLNSTGTRAWISASQATNNVPYNGFGKINKKQINAKIYQPLGGDDFIAIAGHFNSNRNHVFGSVPLRIDASPSRTVGTSNAGRFTLTRVERDYTINFPCTTTMPRPGLPDLANSCGTDFDRRYNPSDTGNVRISSRFTLAEGLVLTVDPSFQYVKAAGGTSAITAREGLRDIDPTSGTNNVAGFLGGNPYFGRDINGDGDALDQVTIWAPSMTQTRRYGLITGLRWEMNDNHTFRVGYTLDRARHRQTGEVALVWGNGEPYNVFPMDDLQKDVNGNVLQKRDRLSYATLHQVFGEYRGQFMDNRLEITAGVRAPFFKRDLTNYCFASSASGFVECFGQSATLNTAAQALNPYSSSVNATTGTVSVTGWAPPQNRVYKYNRILPNAGFVFDVADNLSLFGNFSQGLTVPGTDNLYNAFYFPVNTARAQPKPETTDNFDLGVRYRSGTVQAQLSGFYNQFHNRLASAYDPDIGQTVYRNLGNVKKYGIDGSISYSPIPQIALYVFGSVIKSKIRDNLAVGENLDGTPILALTAGKREAGAPKYTFGFTARGTVGPVDLGITAKRTGERYVLDTNEATYTGTFIAPGAKACSGTTTITCVTPNPATAPSRTAIFGETAPAYWLVNLDARVNLKFLGLNDKTFFQANVYNLFDKLYVGGFGGNLNQSQTFAAGTGVSTYGNPGFVQIGAPRTISGTLVFAF